MSKVIKEEVRELKSTSQTLEASMQSTESLLQSSKDQLSNLEQDLSQAKDARIAELNQEIETLTQLKENHKALYSSMNSEIAELEKSLSKIRESKSSVTLNVGEIQKKLDLYSKNKCPHCLSDLTDEAHIGIKDKLIAKKQDQESQIPTLNSEIESASKALSDKKSEQSSARDKFYQVDGVLAPLKQELSTLSQAKPETQKGTEYINNVISSIEGDLSKLSSDRAKVSEKLAVSQEMDVILGDNGMKRLLMSQIIPMLNKKILKTSKLLEFKFTFEFDLEFNPIITHLGMQISPDSLSAGEQKKMNLIVLLCILELLKLKHHKVNLLFLDEVFSSLDVESIYRVVDLLKTFAKKYNMTVFVISHDPLPEEFFDTKLAVENIDHFSDIISG
jgi:DNA repair exonuclease SbcCD ATPase subunit